MRKKNKRKLVTIIVSLAIVIILLVSALQLAGVIRIFADNHGTGLNLDTSANFITHTKQYDPWKGEAWIKGADAEVMTKDKYIVAWQQDQLSSLVTCRADFQYHGRGRCEGFFCAFGYHAGVMLGCYYVTVDYIDVMGVTHQIINTKNNNWFDTNYVVMQRNIPKSDFIEGRGHMLPSTVATYKNYDDDSGDLKGWKWHKPWAEDSDDDAQWYTYTTHTIEFKLKGSLVGGLRTTYYIEAAERNNQVVGWNWHPGYGAFAVDEAYLASGEGEVIVTSTNAVSSDGTATTDETNIVYTKYVYEEGLDVVMQVDAGYSGASLDPNEPGYNQGWALEIYDSTGTSRYSEYIPDNVRGHTVTYTVPSGAFIPNDPNDNEWRVVLKNTLFDQSETRLFVIDKFEYMPGQTTISTDKQRYVQWETVSVTLTANSNVQTARPISHFRAWATYGSAGGVDYAYTVHTLPAQGAGGVYTASFSFQLTKGATNIYIRAHAIDDEGRAGPEGEWNVYSTQAVGNYQVTVIVTDSGGTPIQGALANMGSSSATSTVNGIATLYVNYGSYTLTVSKTGHTTFTQAGIQVQSDMSISATMSRTGAVDDWILYAGLAVVSIMALIGVWWYLRRKSGTPLIFKKKKKKRR